MTRTLLLSLLLCGCAGKASHHRAPDRTKFMAATMRVEKALPVVARTHEELVKKIARVRSTHLQVVESHAAEAAQIEALVPNVAKIRELAFRTNPTDVDLAELKGEVEKLDSTVAQLRASAGLTATQLTGNTNDLAEVKELESAQGRAIEELTTAKNETMTEARIVIDGYETALGAAHGDWQKAQASADQRGNWLGWMGAATGVGLALRFIVFTVPYTYAFPVVAGTAGYFLARTLI